ncbi:hypothetical protein PITC_040730 [Penicillium italicum]|uniref:Ankyrin repeat-containing domain-containing protein n=1 Tax=Penicillium italicum TaxID=40296 RepID=A0A0A2LP44_PENIT|nr:hypothetical protein PITC_040730 [Penicillium italicum]
MEIQKFLSCCLIITKLFITTDFIEEYAESYIAIETLLSRAPDVVITSQMLYNATEDILIERLREAIDMDDVLCITGDNVAYATRFASYEDMPAKIEFLLERSERSKGTEENMIEAISTCRNSDVIQSLLNHG